LRASVKLLRDAVSKGYKDVARVKKDTDLDPLRQRDDFLRRLALQDPHCLFAHHQPPLRCRFS
jgi:hypothetical protein